MIKMTYYYWQNDELFIKAYVQPRAKKNAIVGLHNDRLKIQIKALPTEDKANKELISFLADYLHIAPSTIQIAGGQHSRNKLVRLMKITKNAMTMLPEF